MNSTSPFLIAVIVVVDFSFKKDSLTVNLYEIKDFLHYMTSNEKDSNN